MSLFPRNTLIRAALPGLAAAALVGGSALLAAPAAYAAPADGTITATYKGDGTGLEGVMPDASGKRWPAGTFVMTVEGKTVEAYCIEFTNFSVEKTGGYTTQTWAASGAKNLAKAADVAARHATIGTPMDDEKWEKAATQAAIWHFTDAVGWDKTGSAKFTARVDQLIKGAKAINEPVASFKLTGTSEVAGTGDDATNVLVGKVTTAAGAPLAGQSVRFVVDGQENVVKTAADGTAKFELDADDEARSAKILVTGTVGAGTVLAPASGKQKMITEAPVDVTRELSLKLAAAPAPKPIPTPTPVTPKPTVPAPAPTPVTTPSPVATKPAPAPVPVKTPEEKKETPPAKLPHTGGGAAGWMLLAGLGAAGAGFVGRKYLLQR